jgi:hypothetical protein
LKEEEDQEPLPLWFFSLISCLLLLPTREEAVRRKMKESEIREKT